MSPINLDDPRLHYPGFYNIYPVITEISSTARPGESSLFGGFQHLLDEYYGRILKRGILFPYGNSSNLPFYKSFDDYEIIDTFRVPFRKIPVYKYIDIEQIEKMLSDIIKENPNHEILLRGQTSAYLLGRNAEENKLLYGEEMVKEPSLLPSSLRSEFNELFIDNLWYSQTVLMLNDVGIDLKNILNEEQLEEYYKDVTQIKQSHDFTLLSLGIAQHYGLPSVGLDLTKTIKVAAWFASNKVDIGLNGVTNTHPTSTFDESTIFIFSCPKDSVYSYSNRKPKFIEHTRPDRQDAWFGHVGWGCAKNELASFLVCAIRLDCTILSHFEKKYETFLFPERSTDLVLNYFLDAKSNLKYKGEAKRALDRIYSLAF